MDLSTTYLGLRLSHPIVPGAGPLTGDLDTVRRLEDAGAAAIVMGSLFEETIVAEQMNAFHLTEAHGESFGEAMSYFPETDVFAQGPNEYLEKIQRLKAAVGVPVIASLNGVTLGGWTKFASRMESAGADALELNVYYPSTEPDETAQDVEERVVQVVRAVKAEVSIPLAVKISPFYSAPFHFARRLAEAGATGLVIFNRFYQPDIDLEALTVDRRLHLSVSHELLPRLHWLALLSGRIDASLAVTGGVHTPTDAIKAVMCGAHAVQMVSALLKDGLQRLTEARDGMAAWLEEHEYESLEQMQGSMSMLHCPNPMAYARANYMDVLHSWE
jgi:dihydroorotate dehydrogenase (fumarate)